MSSQVRDVPIGIKIIQKVTEKCCRTTYFNRNLWYRSSVWILTFLAYMGYHATRKTLSVVKTTFHRNCSELIPPESVNASANPEWCDWKPFDGPDSSGLLGALDSSFLFAYAGAMFVSGIVAERVSLRYFLALGMILSGVACYLLGVAKIYNIHSLLYFILTLIFGGIVQTTGWPGVVAVMGNWFEKEKRGLIMGIWNSHTSIGNIVGTLIASYYLESDWSLSFIMPGLLIAVIGLLNFLFLVTNPADVGCTQPNRPNQHDKNGKKFGSVEKKRKVKYYNDKTKNSISDSNVGGGGVGDRGVGGSFGGAPTERNNLLTTATTNTTARNDNGNSAAAALVTSYSSSGASCKNATAIAIDSKYSCSTGASNRGGRSSILIQERLANSNLNANASGMSGGYRRIPAPVINAAVNSSLQDEYDDDDDDENSLSDSELLPSHEDVKRVGNEGHPILSDGAPDKAVGFFGALCIPGVVEFSLCLFFAKLVSYTFLYWLPLYITSSTNYSATDSADVSTLFDIGGIVGGITAGLISDYSGMSATTCAVMLFLAIPVLFVYYIYGAASLAVTIVLLLLTGLLVNGPYALITTAVSAELGTHHSLAGNSKALATVTAIIDGTGSIGAAVGPLLAGLFSGLSWEYVFYLLMLSDLLALLLLIRLVTNEIKQLRSASYPGWSP